MKLQGRDKYASLLFILRGESRSVRSSSNAINHFDRRGRRVCTGYRGDCRHRARRAESLQDVPISISAVTAEDIVATGSLDLKDLSIQIPNFVFAETVNQGLSFISIRGTDSRTEPSEIGFDSSVGVYVDGVFHSRQFNANANMGDIERVEVLRGHQGTPFGRNTISGAINITSKKPATEDFFGSLSVDAGNRNMIHAHGSVNVPLLEDSLAMKLFFAESYEIDGYADNVTTGNDELGSKKKTSVRFQVRYTPSDQTTVDLSVRAYESDSDDYFFEHIDGPASDGRDYTTINDTENTSKIELFNTSVTLEHELENGYTLTSTTALLDDELTFEADVEATPNPVTCIILGNPALTETTDAPVDVKLEEWTWTAGVRYQLNQDVMIYGSVGTGVKSGAFNNTPDPVADFAANNLITDHEEVTSYEPGMKSSWLDNRLNLNFALFRMDYDDLQVRLGCVNCGPGGLPLRFLSNAGTAEGEGFELELVALPTESTRFTAGIGYMDTVYDELTDVEDQRRGGFFDAGGNTLPLAPEWTINVSAQHTAALMGGSLTSRLDLSYVDERYSDGSFHNHPDDVLPSQTLLGVRLGYRPASDNWGISLWAKNLTDDDSTVYRAFGTAFLPFGTNRAQYQQPRTYGVTLDLSF